MRWTKVSSTNLLGIADDSSVYRTISESEKSKAPPIISYTFLNEIEENVYITGNIIKEAIVFLAVYVIYILI